MAAVGRGLVLNSRVRFVVHEEDARDSTSARA
jgi:hypothetical protein